MSRRKQSNPKPLKRQSEDSLYSIAALLRLPLDTLSVRDPQDDVNEYTLYTRRRLKSGTTFGPYEGRLVPDDQTDGLNVVQTRDQRGEAAHFALTDEAGGWLKLLRPVHSSDEPCNAALFHNGCAAWCTITSDLESETELLVRHQWAGDVLPPATDDPREPDPRQRIDRAPADDGHTLDSDRNDSDTDNCSHRSPNIYCDIYNGRLSVEPLVKREPSSPGTTTPPLCTMADSTEDAPAFLNGSNYAPAFPCGGTTVASVTDGPLRCEHCDAFFNSRRILDVHQTYYCQGRATAGHLLNSDTDTEDAAKTDSATAAHSPRASEHDDASSPPKDLPSHSPEDGPSPRRPRTDPPRRLFQCQCCSYSTEKKASLTRHVRMHGGPARAADGPPLATPPMARYCANCDIQFASYKNYQVHKEYYCNTRHVHKSVSSSSPTSTQQQPQQPSSPGDSQPSTTEKPGYNVVLKQPLYAAISTSPLILVPCSYVAGAGGLSPGLVPAGNIVIPNPQASSPDPHKSVIPTFTVIPDEPAKKEDKPPTREDAAPKISKPEVVKSPAKTEAEQPLDLSFRKRSPEGTKRLTSDSGSSHVSPSSPCEDIGAPPNLPVVPLPNPDLVCRDTPVLAPPVLVKQGASKCVECNIVFYKHENYLVHKNKYCAARARREGGESPPEKQREESSTPDREEQGKTSQKSPISSPRMNNSRTPPAADAECLESTPQVQYYCMACGIKYSSLDNLRAHQLYYCPKREVQPLAIVPSYPGLPHSRPSTGQDYKCNKCKNAYPTEELLRQHPCVVQRKCPYCDVYCPTLSAAQRHLVTHTGIKSFRCSLCGYKGHTLRGMRTHIRIHLDKNNSSTPEEAYILCMDEGGAEIGCAGRKTAGVRVNSDRIKSVIATEPPHPDIPVAPPPAIVPPDVLAIKAVPDDPVATGDTTHWCQICGYSSSYKGNVVRHVKLVHKDLVSTQAMSNIVNSRPSAESLLKQCEPLDRAPSREAVSMAEHSNSSSSLDVKPTVNGLAAKTDQALRLEDKPLMLKAEATSPPPPSSSKGVKRPLSEDGQCGAFSSKSGPKYCKSCDISFNYLSNFLAHKKFYCTPRQGDVSTQESTSVQPVQ